MNPGFRLVVLLVMLSAPGAADGRAREMDACLDLAGEGSEGPGGSAGPAAWMGVTVSGEARPIGGVRLRGLKVLSEEQVWQIAGPRPEGEVTPGRAASILARLTASGLFASVNATLDVIGETAMLDVTLVEHPLVSRIVIEGLAETGAEDLLEALLDAAPGRGEPKRPRRDGRDGDGPEDGGDGDAGAEKGPAGACETPRPPRGWLAHPGAGGVAPGIVWQGLRSALDRGLEMLSGRGYAMASIEGELATDGTLTLHVDEGHLEALELQGVEPAVEPEVRKLLGLGPGDVFLMDDLEQGVKRVRRTLPFLVPARIKDGRRAMPRIAEERLEDGRVRFRTVEGGSRRSERFRGHGKVEIGGRRLTWRFDGEEPGAVALPETFFSDEPSYVSIRGRHATVRFQPSHTGVDWKPEELLHHTQVQGYAPGLLLSLGLLDPENRAHFTLDGGVWLNTARPRQRIDYLVGARLRIPWLRVAEIGAQRYSLTDTSDGWRATPLSSYLGSGLLNRPDREYHRRDGFTGLLTLHLWDRLAAGVEYRNDIERSMESAGTSQSLFYRRQPPWANSPIDEGRSISLVGRLEWSSRPALASKVGGPLRSPERRLIHPDHQDQDPGWRSVNTVEVADPRLGGDLHFTRLVSDTAFHLRTGDDSALRGRLRVAGGVDLPAQKREALGGWTALRGYDFKELRGDASVLLSAEYQWAVFSAFVDVGAVRDAGAWSPAKVAVGAAFNLGDLALAAAWRTDDRARLTPELRLVFQRTY